MSKVFASLHQYVAAIGLQATAFALSVTVQELTEFLFGAKASRRFVLHREVRRVLVSGQLKLTAEFPITLALAEHDCRRRVAYLWTQISRESSTDGRLLQVPRASV